MWTETIELNRHKKVHLYTIFNYGLFLTQVYSRASEDPLFYRLSSTTVWLHSHFLWSTAHTKATFKPAICWSTKMSTEISFALTRNSRLRWFLVKIHRNPPNGKCGCTFTALIYSMSVCGNEGWILLTRALPWKYLHIHCTIYLTWKRKHEDLP